VAKTGKTGKGKKSHTATESSFLDATAGGDSTPAAKTKKGKKSKTPSEYGTDGAATSGANGSDSGVSPKHSKTKSSDSNLQPFMSGGSDEAEPKVKESKNVDKGAAGSKSSDSPKNYESRPAGNGFAAEQARTPKGEKSGKGEKKKKADDANPPGQ